MRRTEFELLDAYRATSMVIGGSESSCRAPCHDVSGSKHPVSYQGNSSAVRASVSRVEAVQARALEIP